MSGGILKGYGRQEIVMKRLLVHRLLGGDGFSALMYVKRNKEA